MVKRTSNVAKKRRRKLNKKLKISKNVKKNIKYWIVSIFILTFFVITYNICSKYRIEDTKAVIYNINTCDSGIFNIYDVTYELSPGRTYCVKYRFMRGQDETCRSLNEGNKVPIRVLYRENVIKHISLL